MEVSTLATLLLDLAVIVGAAQLLGGLVRRLGQPAVIGEILGGILLGPTLFDGEITAFLFPAEVRPPLTALANIGVCVFMFLVGLEFNRGLLRGQGPIAVSVSLSAIVLPFSLGALVALRLVGNHPTGHQLTFVLFLGTAMSVTAFPVLARILTDKGLVDTPIGGLALAAAAVDDVLAWSMPAAVTALAGVGGAPWQILLVLPYATAMMWIVRPLLARMAKRGAAAGPPSRAAGRRRRTARRRGRTALVGRGNRMDGAAPDLRSVPFRHRHAAQGGLKAARPTSTGSPSTTDPFGSGYRWRIFLRGSAMAPLASGPAWLLPLSNGRRFVSPVAAASGGTRAVVVWSGLRARHGEPFFHLSVARDGAEQYAFTYADGEIRQSGEIPRALDPSRFFGDLADGAAVERSLLDAVAREFGASLPRHALVNGRLHTFATRSWTRPPRNGESYMVIRMDQGDARRPDGRRTGEDRPGSR